MRFYVAANYPINGSNAVFNNRLFRGNRTTKAHADGFDALPHLPICLNGSEFTFAVLNTPPRLRF